MRDAIYYLWPLPFLWCACVPAAALQPLARVTSQSSTELTESITELDTMCQARSQSLVQAEECRAARDKGRRALIAQAEAWKGVTR